MPIADHFWTALFPDHGDAGRRTLRLRLVRKRGRPFLLVPERAAAAAACLDLYPAQRPLARCFRGFLRLAFRRGWYPGCPRTALTYGADEALSRFLIRTIGGRRDELPELGMLAGNPAAAGQRFLILVFDASGQPRVAIKGGVSEAARQLIARETEFLREWGGRTPGVPALRDALAEPGVVALALDYIAGESPAPGLAPGIGPVLERWIQPGQKLPMGHLQPWRDLAAASAAETRRLPLDQALAAREVVPVLFHGDFAPWNIRVDKSGAWHVLDWERGAAAGPPAWDWYHYAVQTGILVERLPVAELMSRMRRLWASAEFSAYARACGIVGLEAPLFRAYLQYLVQAIRPSEGLAAATELLLTTQAMKLLQG